MAPAQPDALLAQLRWRYATKKFDPARKIDDATWSKIEQAVSLAPSSYGLQPYRFLVITDPKVRAELRGHSWNQTQITDASHMILFAQKREVAPADVDRYMQRIAHVRGVTLESLDGFKNTVNGSMSTPSGLGGGSMLAYTRSQTYIALGFALATAAMLGVDACPMEGFKPDEYDRILKLPQQGLRAAVVATFGYRAADDAFASAKKVRLDLDDIVIRI